MKKIFTLMIAVGMFFGAEAQLTRKTYYNNFAGAATAPSVDNWAGRDFQSSLVSDSRIHSMGAPAWLIDNSSMDAVTITAVNPDWEWVSIATGNQKAWEGGNDPKIDIKHTPFVSFVAKNSSGTSVSLRVGLHNDYDKQSFAFTMPANSSATYNFTFGGSSLTAVENSALLSGVTGIQFRKEGTFSTAPFAIDDLKIGLVSDPLQSISILGEDFININTSAMYDERPFPGHNGYAMTWESSNPAVATIDGIGSVRALTVGTTSIIGYAVYGGTTITSEKLVTVENNAPTGVTIGGGAMTLTIDDIISASFAGSVLPSKADQRVIWSIAPSNLAAIDQTGKVLALGNGNVTVTATSVADNTKKGTQVITISGQVQQSVAVSQGYIRNDFEDLAFTGMSYAVFGQVSGRSLTGHNILPSATNPSPLTFIYPTSSGSNTGTDGPSGLENNFEINFGVGTGGRFDAASARFSFVAFSTQSMPVNIFITTSPGNIFGNRISKSVTLTPGFASYSVLFDNAGFAWEQDFKMYMAVNNYGGQGPKPAGEVIFYKMELGQSLTAFSITTDGGNMITAGGGAVNVGSVVAPAGASTAFTYTLSGITFNGNTTTPDGGTDLTELATYQGGTINVLTAANVKNGIVTISGTTNAYPQLMTKVVVTISGNFVPAATSVTLSPPSVTLGRSGSQQYVATLAPTGATVPIERWAVSNAALTRNSSGLVTVASNAAAGTYTVSFTGIRGSVTVTGTAMVTVTIPSSPVCSVTGFTVSTTTSPVGSYVLSIRSITGSNGSACTPSVTGVSWTLTAGSFSIAGTSLTATITGTPTTTTSVITAYAVISGVTRTYSITVPGVVVSIPSAINAGLSSNSVSVYPNPASESISVAVEGATVVSIALVSATGQEVLTSTSTSVSLAGVTKGFYIVVISTDKGTVRKTLIVE